MAEVSSPYATKTPDWGEVRTRNLTLSPEQLSQYSRSRLDPSTIEIAKLLCKNFPLCLGAKEYLEQRYKSQADIINEVHQTNTSLISNIAESEDGLLLLGITGVLTEHYDDESVGAIFIELAKWAKLPEDMAPTLQQWQTTVKSLDVKLGSVELSSAVEMYTKLGQGDAYDGLKHTDASAVAAALSMMALMIDGQHPKLGIASVGKDAGWFAAVAGWLYDLKFDLRSKDDRVLYSSVEAEIQISIRFKDPGFPCDGIPIEDVPLVPREGI